MPIFEYGCKRCGGSFEAIRKADDVSPPCPNCMCEETVKLVSCPSPRPKGDFPFKPGPVSPLASTMGRGGCRACGGEDSGA